MSSRDYDSEHDDVLTPLRIPVTCSHPRWAYLVAFDTASEAKPTGLEALMLASYLGEYIHYWYNTTWQAKLAREPFDVDGGANGVIFHKFGDGDWGYRRRSFERGPLFWPGFPGSGDRQEAGIEAFGLPALLDQLHRGLREDGGVHPRWVKWKAAHPEVFGGDVR